MFVSNNKLCGELNGTKSGLDKKNTLDGFKGYGKLDKTTTRESISTQLFCHTVAGSRTKNTHTHNYYKRRQLDLLVFHASTFEKDFIQRDHSLSEEHVQPNERPVHHRQD